MDDIDLVRSVRVSLNNIFCVCLLPLLVCLAVWLHLTNHAVFRCIWGNNIGGPQTQRICGRIKGIGSQCRRSASEGECHCHRGTRNGRYVVSVCDCSAHPQTGRRPISRFQRQSATGVQPQPFEHVLAWIGRSMEQIRWRSILGRTISRLWRHARKMVVAF